MPHFIQWTRRAGLTGSALIALSGCVAIVGNTPSTEFQSEKTVGNQYTPFSLAFDSRYDFDETLSRLTAGIDARGLKTFAVIDHAKGAASIDETLRPTTLVIFGNPKGGTPLMQAAQSMGFDLPLKALVYETADGRIEIAVSDIEAIFAAHSDDDAPPAVGAIAAMLEGLAREAGR